MVTLGTDAQKWSHTVVAADEQGRQVGQVRVTATPEGHLRALRWAAAVGDRGLPAPVAAPGAGLAGRR